MTQPTHHEWSGPVLCHLCWARQNQMPPAPATCTHDLQPPPGTRRVRRPVGPGRGQGRSQGQEQARLRRTASTQCERAGCWVQGDQGVCAQARGRALAIGLSTRCKVGRQQHAVSRLAAMGNGEGCRRTLRPRAKHTLALTSSATRSPPPPPPPHTKAPLPKPMHQYAGLAWNQHSGPARATSLDPT